MRKINKQTGFTLIELIMVIVILGVLSAFALPRFADLGGSARAATINGVSGSMKAAANIAHAQQLANGASGSTAVVLEGVTITMANGYPDDAGILLAAQISSTEFTTSTAGIVQAIGSVTPANCQATYNEATSAGTPAVITAASVAVDVSDC
jgi:MSHA pilin protein MshA